MATPEGEQIYNIMDIKQALEATQPYHRYDPEKAAPMRPLAHFPHINNLNDASSDLIAQAEAKAEAEAAAAARIPTIRRPLSRKRLAALTPTIFLG